MAGVNLVRGVLPFLFKHQIWQLRSCSAETALCSWIPACPRFIPALELANNPSELLPEVFHMRITQHLLPKQDQAAGFMEV